MFGHNTSPIFPRSTENGEVPRQQGSGSRLLARTSTSCSNYKTPGGKWAPIRSRPKFWHRRRRLYGSRLGNLGIHAERASRSASRQGGICGTCDPAMPTEGSSSPALPLTWAHADLTFTISTFSHRRERIRSYRLDDRGAVFPGWHCFRRHKPCPEELLPRGNVLMFSRIGRKPPMAALRRRRLVLRVGVGCRARAMA